MERLSAGLTDAFGVAVIWGFWRACLFGVDVVQNRTITEFNPVDAIAVLAAVGMFVNGYNRGHI